MQSAIKMNVTLRKGYHYVMLSKELIYGETYLTADHPQVTFFGGIYPKAGFKHQGVVTKIIKDDKEINRIWSPPF